MPGKRFLQGRKAEVVSSDQADRAVLEQRIPNSLRSRAAVVRICAL